MPPLYRPNVAALLMNADGKLLVCERSKTPGAWQFPQGGIDEGETAEQALLREIEEETGYEPDDFEIMLSRGNYRYDYPEEVREQVKVKRGESFIGQEQTYFLCALYPGSGVPKLDDREFSRYKWIWPEKFELGWLPSFKREVYKAVLKDFFRIDLEG